MTAQFRNNGVSTVNRHKTVAPEKPISASIGIADSSEFFAAGPIANAIRKLARAYQYSIDCDRSKWDFAVEISGMDTLGVSHDELRWMVGKGLVEHAQEITEGNGICRSFESPGGFTFSPNSCFVVTPAGLDLAIDLMLESSEEFPEVAENSTSTSTEPGCPVWDDQRHELKVGGVIVKRFKWRASNQEAILAAFQEDGWPARIDDPLSPLPETDPKRRLSDTIKCLNRKQVAPLLRFSGDGTGEGVLWDVVQPETPDNDG